MYLCTCNNGQCQFVKLSRSPNLIKQKCALNNVCDIYYYFNNVWLNTRLSVSTTQDKQNLWCISYFDFNHVVPDMYCEVPHILVPHTEFRDKPVTVYCRRPPSPSTQKQACGWMKRQLKLSVSNYLLITIHPEVKTPHSMHARCVGHYLSQWLWVILNFLNKIIHNLFGIVCHERFIGWCYKSNDF